ncbi:hypothetical protein HETIRDRAFT_332302, partial [Heterobasidion irregulare TC 32-1]
SIHIFVDEFCHVLPPVVSLHHFQCFCSTRVSYRGCIMMCFDDESSDDVVFGDAYVAVASGGSVFVCPMSQ